MFTCDVCFPDRTETIDMVTSAVFSTDHGEVQVLDGHAEAFFLLIEGQIVLTAEGQERMIRIGEGCGYVKGNALTFIAVPLAS